MIKKLSFLALSCVILFSACKKDSKDPGPDTSKARVMFVHTTISADTLKVQVNNASLTSVPGLSFLSASNYVELTPGSTKIAFTLASANVILDSATTSLSANNAYSVFTTGVVNNPALVIINDDLSAPVGGSAKVRFVNLSPDNLNESFYIGANKLDSNIAYKGSTSFKTITAGSYDIVALPQPNSSHLVKTLAGQAFAAGKVYTVIVYGTELGAGAAKLNVKVLSNN